VQLVHLLRLVMMFLGGLPRQGESDYRVLNARGFQKMSETVMLCRL
jgi:hypothetical protein